MFRYFDNFSQTIEPEINQNFDFEQGQKLDRDKSYVSNLPPPIKWRHWYQLHFSPVFVKIPRIFREFV